MAQCVQTRTQKKVKEKKKPFGEPTEVAIVNAAIARNINKEELYKIKQRVKDIQYDSTRKMMTTIHKTNNGYIGITKGAPDILLKKCNKYFDGNKEMPISIDILRKIESSNNKMADKALRVIAVTYKSSKNIKEITEQDLIFVGLIGMIDPPREGVKEAV